MTGQNKPVKYKLYPSPKAREPGGSVHRDAKLRLFILQVRRGETPPQSLLDYIADGVEAFLKDEKPWPIKVGRKKRDPEISLQAHALNEIGVSKARASELLGLDRGNGSDYTKTLRRYIEYGRAIAQSGCAGHWHYLFSLDALSEKSLSSEEYSEIQILIKNLEEEDPGDYVLGSNGQ